MSRLRGSGALRDARLVLLGSAAGAALGLAGLSLGLALGAWARGAAPAAQALLQGGASALEPPGLLPRGLSQDQPRAPRHRRAAPRKRPRSRKAAAAPAWAAHYEVQAGASRDGILAEADGTIRGWAESRLNATSPLSYDPASGGFRVARPGLYYLYSQVPGRLGPSDAWALGWGWEQRPDAWAPGAGWEQHPDAWAPWTPGPPGRDGSSA